MPQYDDELAILSDEADAVERLDHIATRVEADGEVLYGESAAHPKAAAGSAPVTRRRAAKQATTPTTTATSGRTAARRE